MDEEWISGRGNCGWDSMREESIFNKKIKKLNSTKKRLQGIKLKIWKKTFTWKKEAHNTKPPRCPTGRWPPKKCFPSSLEMACRWCHNSCGLQGQASLTQVLILQTQRLFEWGGHRSLHQGYGKLWKPSHIWQPCAFCMKLLSGLWIKLLRWSWFFF